MNRFVKAAAVFLLGVLGGVCPLAAQTADIGKITLSAPNFGYQTVGVYNLTGATQGCEQFAAQYNVCNGLNIASWQLTVTFTANATGLAPSPLVFTSNGAADQIPPTGSSFTAYTGEAANPWSLSFSLQNAGCSPSCDATISSITFSGTLDTTSLNLYNTSAAGPYILDSLPASAFSVTWNIPATDYTATPGSLFDSTDILITNQQQLTSQTITFGSLSDQLLTATTPALSATATSSLKVTFTSNSAPVCTVTGTDVTLVSAGLCSITASQPGNSTYAAAPPVTQTFNVTQAPQTITFGTISDIALTATPPALSATASSGLPVTFTSATQSVCTVNETAVTLNTGGTCSITASQPGSAIYAPAPTVTQSFTVNLTPQTITFNTIGNQILTVGGSLALTATASSSLAVSYISNTLSICTVSTSTVAFVTVGNCSITASQAGNGATYAAAASVTQTFNIQATQTITFGAISDIALTATPPALSATASSGLVVTFTSTTQSVCTVSGTTTVKLVAAGVCTITASQTGDPTHAAATAVMQSFNVQGSQTITFGPLSNIALNATPAALSATATSGLTVSFASTTTGVCTVSGTNGTVLTLVSFGTCSITASQAGSSTYTAAPNVSQSFLVLKPQTISFFAPGTQTVGNSPTVGAIASSNLPVTYSSNSTSICTITATGPTITLITSGTCSITASQAGDGTTYAAAPSVTVNFNVNFERQSISFGLIPPQVLGTTLTLTGTSSSGLQVSYASNSLTVCAVSTSAGTSTVTFLTAGQCSITASQAGSLAFSPAPTVSEIFTVAQQTQTITFNSPGAQILTTSPSLTATSTSGLAVSFASNSQTVCTVPISGSPLTLLTAGTCSITASQAGTAIYAAAATVTQTFAVNLVPQTVTFAPINTILLGATPPPLSATASSTLPVTFASTTGSVCTVATTSVTLVAVGTCSITATQAGNSTYAAASATQMFLVTTLTPQTITFGTIPTQTIGVATPALSATASSGLGVTFISTSSSVCTVSNNTTINLVSIGTCSITASQPGNGTYAAATSIIQMFAVNGRPQTITFNTIPTQTLGTPPPALGATASSTLAVSYTSTSLTVCTVSNTTPAMITLLSAGACSITASQAGSSTYAAATSVTQTFTVNLTPQTISFGPINNILLSAAAPALSATASSTLGVTFTSNTTSVCTVSGTAVALVAIGTCSITATQAGNSTYAAASATQTFLVTTLTPQTITFGTIPTQTIGVATPALSATASSGLGVTFISTSSSVCTVSNNTTINLVSIGTCSITASQPGNGTYAAATSIMQTFAVNGRPQTISFNTIPTQTLGTPPPTLNATASSGLAVSYTSTSLTVCTVSNTTPATMTLLSAGVCSITASQAGSTTYAAASSVTQTFTVNLTPQTINFGPISNILLSATAPALSATASSTLGVIFTSNSTSVCTVSGTAVALVAVGTCSITASQAGNSTYAAASVTQTFIVTTLTLQSITFGPLSPQAFGATPPALSATATSGLRVTFTSNSTSVCTVATTTITLVSVGTCSITASQPGDLTTYAPATSVMQTFAVTQGANIITFTGPGTQTLGTTAPALSATATSGLVVTFASTTTSVCTVSVATLTLVTTGTCTITASQAGNTNYVAATSVNRSFTINPASSGGGGGGGGGGGTTGSSLTVAPTSVTINATTGGAPGTAQVVLSYPTFTQGAPTFSTNFNVNNGQGWLSVSPPNGTMSPGPASGLQFNYTVTLTISADPSKVTAGQTYTGTVNISAAGGIVSVPVTFTISSTPAKYTVAPASLTFNYQLGGTATPPSQNLAVFSAPLGAGYTVSASSTGGSGNWLSTATASTTPVTPSVVSVAVSTSGFTQAGQYSGQVAINTGASTIDVPVTFNIAAAQPPALAVAPVQETFSIQQGGSPVNGQLTVSNTGGGTLSYSASATGNNNWLTIVGSGSGSATPSSPATVAFTINPQGLNPGVYNGQISVNGASSTKTTTIVLTIASPQPQIQLSRSGIALSGIAGGSASAPEVVTVSNSGGGSMQWKASSSTLSGGNWLTVSPLTGNSAAGAAGTAVSISANPGNLTPGTYSGSVNFTAQGAVNSPQTVSVTFTVSGATQTFPVGVLPAGEILVGTAGSTTPVSANLFLFNAGAKLAYSASTSASWLSVSPASGSLNSFLTTLQISVDFSKLNSFLQLGSVSLGFGDGSGATVSVLALALPSGAKGNNVAGLRPMTTVSACPGGKPSFLIPIFQQPSSGASLQASYPADVTVQVIDDCGNPVTATAGGSVQVTFSNGDPGINLVDTGSGVWEGTWTPATAASQVTLQIAASENGVTLNSGSGVASSETVSVAAAAAGAPPQPTGIANAASAGQAIPQLVAPGSYVAIYGTNLAGSGNPNATALQPLPTTLNGTQVTLGGLPLALNYASPTQVNAVIPQGIVPNATYPLIVVNGTTQSVPVAMTVTELQPGTYTFNESGSGAGVVTDALTGNPITASNPAHAGQNLVIYMTGLGPLIGTNGEQEPADGAIAPTTTLYHTTSNVSVTIGGVPVAATQFAGLTPTLTALYQVNVQMPTGVTPGAAVPVVVTATDPATGTTASSNSVTIAVQ